MQFEKVDALWTVAMASGAVCGFDVYAVIDGDGGKKIWILPNLVFDQRVVIKRKNQIFPAFVFFVVGDGI